jgi:outer membrane receptor for ferrienterochelin and colicins
MTGRASNIVTCKIVGGFAAGLLTSVSAVAQVVPDAAAPEAAVSTDAGTQVFTPADFVRFTPRSALDMVEKIPDFTLIAVDGDRGLGQASENILINGERIAGKSNDARTTLARISASAVQRIELVDGATLGIPGLTGRVANVIVASSRIEGLFRWDPQFRRNVEDQLYTGSISANGRIGATDFTLSLSNTQGLRRGGVGPEITTDAAGLLLLTRNERAAFHADQPRLAGSLRREWADGSMLNLNLAGELLFYEARLRAVATPTDGMPVYDDLFLATEDEYNFEAGGDYEFELGSGRLKLIALQSFEHSDIGNTFTFLDRVPGAVRMGNRFERIADEGESVLRGEYSFGPSGSEWQVALEGAYNFLDLVSSFGPLRPDGAFALASFPGSDTFVDEWRGEATVTRGWRLASGLTLQTTAGAEYSKISQTGTGGLSRSFVRPKGSAALAWVASPRLTVNAGIERQVGQLSFFDFAAFVDIQNDAASAGNVQLVPEQTWRVEGEAIRSLGPAGSVTVGGYHEWISDIVDRVPLSPTEEGVGNLPSARRWGVIGRGTLLLDTLGWRGARLNGSAEFRHSSVRDPVTGDNRRISADLKRRWSGDFRHDIPNSQIAWGGQISEERVGPIFRLDQTFESSLTRPITQVFIEHKDVFGLTVRLTARNLNNTRDDIRRDYFVNRRDGPIDYRERQLRDIHLIGVLSISGSF